MSRPDARARCESLRFEGDGVRQASSGVEPLCHSVKGPRRGSRDIPDCRAKRETWRAQRAPTLPRLTSATMRSKPARCTPPAAERPRSSSMTSIPDELSAVGRSQMEYCRAKRVGEMLARVRQVNLNNYSLRAIVRHSGLPQIVDAFLYLLSSFWHINVK
jgi:hypothetical protein